MKDETKLTTTYGEIVDLAMYAADLDTCGWNKAIIALVKEQDYE